MPILTKINGEPSAIKRMASQLRTLGLYLCDEVDPHVRSIHDESDRTWQDDAADAFRERVRSGGKSAYKLSWDFEVFARALETYADALEMAKQKMASARHTALDGMLLVTDTHIGDVPPPKVQTPHGTIDYTIGGNHDRMKTAYEQASAEAKAAEEILSVAWTIGQIGMKDASDKRYFHLGDFTVGMTADVNKHVKSALEGQIKHLRGEAADAYARVHANTEPSVDKKLWSEYRQGTAKIRLYQSRVARAIKVGKGIKIGGWGLVLAGMGWDIKNGKPMDKALFSTLVGLGGTQAGQRLPEFVLGRIESSGRTARIFARFGPGAIVLGGVLGGIGGGAAADYFFEDFRKILESPPRDETI